MTFLSPPQQQSVTDVSGASNFILLAWLSFGLGPASAFTRPLFNTLLVTVWGLRLGAYLLRRVLKRGHDARFDEARCTYACNVNRLFRTVRSTRARRSIDHSHFHKNSVFRRLRGLLRLPGALGLHRDPARRPPQRHPARHSLGGPRRRGVGALGPGFLLRGGRGRVERRLHGQSESRPEDRHLRCVELEQAPQLLRGEMTVKDAFGGTSYPHARLIRC